MQDAFGRADSTRKSRMDAWQASIDRAEKRRLERERAKQEAALQAQKDAAIAARDDRQQKNALQTNAQRASIALDAANVDFQNQTRLNDQERRAIRDRDKRLNQFDTQQLQMKSRDLRDRDQRQFGYTMAENEQQFLNQMDRDAAQHGYTTARDRLQNDATLQRDAFQYGLDTRRQAQQQRDTLQRDMIQSGLQAQRDQRLNQFDLQRDQMQQDNTLERDKLQNRFQTERDFRQNQFQTEGDYRQQGFTQQNMYQRETADVAAKWQEQIQQARNAGLDFSPAQQQEMKLLDKAFRQNVLNSNMREDLKQRAMLEHQKKLATFIPENRVQHPQQVFEQSIVRDQETGQKFIVTQGPNGVPRYEPIDALGSGGGIDQQAKMEEKKAAELRKMKLEREKNLQSLHRELTQEVDADGNRVYDTPEKVDAELLRRFAADEIYYVESGLPPHELFQMKAKQDADLKARESRKATNTARDAAEQQRGYSVMPPQGQFSPVNGGPVQSLQPRINPYSGQPVPEKATAPIVLHTRPLPEQISRQISAIPGGEKLVMIREKHASNSSDDQSIRLSADIVMNAILTGKTDDPDYDEAIQILDKAGFQIGK